MKYVTRGQLVLPGEPIATLDEKVVGEVYSDGARWRAAAIGVVEMDNNVIRVQPLDTVYSPSVGDLVVGYVKEVSLGGWIVDIRAPLPAILPISEAATRYVNIDEVDPATILAPGEAVIARVVKVDPSDEYPTTISIIGEGLGKAVDGLVIEVPITAVGRVSELFKHISPMCNYAVGRNGRVWVRCSSAEMEARLVEAAESLAKLERIIRSLARS